MIEKPVDNSLSTGGLVLLWLLIVAFLIAMVFMFIHPSVTIGLVWLGLVALAGTAAYRAVRGAMHHGS